MRAVNRLHTWTLSLSTYLHIATCIVRKRHDKHLPAYVLGKKYVIIARQRLSIHVPATTQQ
jgi:hypothetical protein